jgi:hypothetical protein
MASSTSGMLRRLRVSGVGVGLGGSGEDCVARVAWLELSCDWPMQVSAEKKTIAGKREDMRIGSIVFVS